jgi:signal transduction histidine kinase/ActR/RegA family two-component response regulator
LTFSLAYRFRLAWTGWAAVLVVCPVVHARAGEMLSDPIPLVASIQGFAIGTLVFLLLGAVGFLGISLWLQKRRTRTRDREIQKLRGELYQTADLLRRFAAGEDISVDKGIEANTACEEPDIAAAAEKYEAIDMRTTLSTISKDLQHVRAELVSAQEAKGDFLANMSHEIRTPMNGIIGTLNLLNDTGLNEDQKSLVEVMRNSSFALLNLINDILDFSQLVSRMMTLEKAPITVRDLIDDTISLFSYQAAEKGIELCHYVDESAPATIFADRQRLQQVLSNIIGNAVKFTYEGEVFVSFTGREVETETGARELILHCSVRDTGVGIAEENQKRIFEAFTQTDESTTRKHGGTGLGLAIARELCRIMGGDIGLESEVWKGSHFYFELPFGGFAEIDPETQKERQRRKKVLETKKLIVLCRQPTLASLINHLCLRYGIEAIVTHEMTQHQMEEVIQMRPDALIIDPNGQPQGQIGRFCGQLNRHGIPWLGLLSAVDRKPDEATFADYKVGFCFKPLTEESLMDALCDLLGEEENYNAKDDPLSIEGSRSFAKQHPLRVMVVDDVEMNRKICSKILQNLGYAEITTANNGREAVEMVGKIKPDVIFMDLQMPEMGGVEAAEKIRADHSLGRQPVIVAITGHALTGVKESCFAVGMNDFMTKPIEVGVLKEVVTRNYAKLVNDAA